MGTEELRFSHQDDYAITAADRESLRQLLAACFDGNFRDRTYYKQVPKARSLVHSDQTIVAQLGLEDRVIRVGADPVRLFGVIDLCVASEWRGRGIASKLLSSIEGLGRTHGIDYAVLFADDPSLYRRHGYEYVPNTVRWLGIDEHRSLTILEKSQGDCLMVKALGERRWDPGAPVDLLGYLF
jgi:GNAT superfamily N-acetyltransferase